MEDEATLKIGQDCTLQFFHTQGHSDHHFSIYDLVSNGIFTGDTLGVSYDEPLKDYTIHFYLPSTSPNQFKHEAMLASLERIKKLNVDFIYFGHFSVTNHVEEVYKQIKFWLPLFVETGEKAVENGYDHQWIAQQLYEMAENYLSKLGVPINHVVYEILKVDTE